MQFEEELMPELELAPRECSSPPQQDDASDEYFSDISDSDINEEDDDDDNGFPIHPKWSEKTMEVARDLAGNTLDPRKTRSQFHTAFSASEVFLAEK